MLAWKQWIENGASDYAYFVEENILIHIQLDACGFVQRTGRAQPTTSYMSTFSLKFNDYPRDQSLGSSYMSWILMSMNFTAMKPFRVSILWNDVADGSGS